LCQGIDYENFANFAFFWADGSANRTSGPFNNKLGSSNAMQIDPPEPEYFFAIFGALVMQFVCVLVSLSIFCFGRKCNSKALTLKISAALPFAFSLPVCFVAARMFWIWVSYWLLGNR
jgi:hypothetical protein